MGSGGDEPAVPAYTGGITKIGGREVASNKKVGNNVVTSYNPTAKQQEAFDIVDTALPSIYKNALNTQDFSGYADTYKNNQLDELSRTYKRGLGDAASQLISSGQMGSSQGLGSLQAFNEPYMQQQANINAAAPIQAQQLRSNDQAYNTNQMNMAGNAINQYYNPAQTFMPIASNASTSGNNYNQWAYPQQLAAFQRQQAQQNAQTGGYIQAGGQALQLAGTLAPMILASDIKTKKNVVKLGNKNGINIYEFEYKTDKYPELPDGKQIGVIAQEVEHIPNAVIQGDKYKLVDYAVIAPLIA